MKRLGQATVIGELLAGIVLGPSLLGHFAPGLSAMIFPPEPTPNHLIEARLVDRHDHAAALYRARNRPRISARDGPRAAFVSRVESSCRSLPGSDWAGMAAGQYLADPRGPLIFSLFMAVAMSISAVPVIAKILIDLDLMRRDLGLLILASGILDDTIGWLMLSVVAGLAAHGTIDVKSIVVHSGHRQPVHRLLLLHRCGPGGAR